MRIFFHIIFLISHIRCRWYLGGFFLKTGEEHEGSLERSNEIIDIVVIIAELKMYNSE